MISFYGRPKNGVVDRLLSYWLLRIFAVVSSSSAAACMITSTSGQLW
jgi:hypothetical protein